MLRRIVQRGEILLNNSDKPSVGVFARAKRNISAGTQVKYGIGSFDFRGSLMRIADARHLVPIGLLQRAVIRRKISAGDVISFDDVSLEDSLALRAWQRIERRVLAGTT